MGIPNPKGEEMTKTQRWKVIREVLILLDNFKPTKSNMMWDEVIVELIKQVKGLEKK